MVLKFFKAQYSAYKRNAAIIKRFPDLKLEQGVIFKGQLENIKIGNNGIIQSHCMFHLGGQAWCDGKGSLVIGNNALFSPGVIVYAAGPGGVEIGDNFDCGPHVGIFSSSTNYKDEGHIFKKVSIGNNVVIYHNATISPGVTIGDGAVIAAGTVVIKDVEPFTLIGGNPAKLIKQLK